MSAGVRNSLNSSFLHALMCLLHPRLCNTHLGWVWMCHGAWYNFISPIIRMWSVRVFVECAHFKKQLEVKSNMNKHTFFMHACTQAHTPLGQPPGGSWGPSARVASGELSLWSFNRPGPWQTALASSACQGAKADPAEPFWLWLATSYHSQKNRNCRASKLLSLSLLGIFNHSLAVFKSSGHVNKHVHTQRQHIRRQTERELNPLDFCLY